MATEYSLQTIKDNLMLFTPEILDEINQIVVQAGHALVKKSPLFVMRSGLFYGECRATG